MYLSVLLTTLGTFGLSLFVRVPIHLLCFKDFSITHNVKKEHRLGKLFAFEIIMAKNLKTPNSLRYALLKGLLMISLFHHTSAKWDCKKGRIMQ